MKTGIWNEKDDKSYKKNELRDYISIGFFLSSSLARIEWCHYFLPLRVSGFSEVDIADNGKVVASQWGHVDACRFEISGARDPHPLQRCNSLFSHGGRIPPIAHPVTDALGLWIFYMVPLFLLDILQRVCKICPVRFTEIGNNFGVVFNIYWQRRVTFTIQDFKDFQFLENDFCKYII